MNKVFSSLKMKYFLPFFVAAYCLIGFRAIYVPATDKVSRSFAYGDGFSDANTVLAIKYFNEHGLMKNYLRPVYNYRPDLGLEGNLYTHYPAFADVFWGVWSIVIGSTNEAVLRIGPILLSLLLIPLMLLVTRIYWSDRSSVTMAVVFILTSNFYIFWADNLYKHLQEALIYWSAILYFWAYYENRKEKESVLKHWLLAPIFGVWVANSSFESITFVATLSVGFSILNSSGIKKLLEPINIHLGVWVILGFVLHMYLNSLALGGWPSAIADMREALSHRSGSSSLEHSPIVQSFLNIFKQVNRTERYFHLPGWILVFFGVGYFRSLLKAEPYKAKVLLVIALASFSWAIIMPQHAKVHHFTAKHLAPLYLILAPFMIKSLYGYWNQLKTYFKNKGFVRDQDQSSKLIFGKALLLVYATVAFITQSLYPTLWSRIGW